jgi:hypothetical protein
MTRKYQFIRIGLFSNRFQGSPKARCRRPFIIFETRREEAITEALSTMSSIVARKDHNSKSRRSIITEASTTMSSVVARKDQNSKSSVFQTRCGRLTGKITKLTTAKAASKLVVPSSFRIIEKPPLKSTVTRSMSRA